MKKQDDTIEIEGVTIEEAIKKAIDVLRVSRDQLSIKIVSEEKKGLFGMEGEKPAKIKVSVKRNKNS